MVNTIWDAIVAGMKFWSHEKTTLPSSTTANNTASFTNTTNTTQTVSNATYTASQAYTFNNNTSVFQQILAHPFDDLAKILYLITALITIFGAITGMIRTVIRYYKKDRIIRPTNEIDPKVSSYKADTNDTTNRPIASIFPKLDASEEIKTPSNTTNLRTETVTQVNSQITHTTAPFYLKNALLEEYKRESNITTWFNKLENFCTVYCLDKLRISKEYIGEINMEYIESLASQNQMKDILDNYDKFKEITIELFKKETSKDSKTKFLERKQLSNETPVYFYAELCKLAKDALPELHEDARNKQVKAQFLRNLANQNIANILAAKSMEDMNIIFKDIKTIEENINTISDNKDQYSNIMVFTRNNQNYNRANNYNSNNHNYNNQERSRREWRNESRNDSPSRYNSNNCHNCGQYGHWKSNCPNQNQANNNNTNRPNQYQASNYQNQQRYDRNINHQSPSRQQNTQQQPPIKTVTNEQKKSLFNMTTNNSIFEELSNAEKETKELLENIVKEKQQAAQQQSEQKEYRTEQRRSLNSDFPLFSTTTNFLISN